MIAYTFYDFLILSLISTTIGLFCWGGIALAVFAFVRWVYSERERKAARASKVVYPASWHRPNDLEEL